MKKIILFFKESYGELKRVVWPTRETVIASTKVVLVSMIMVAATLGLLDFLFLRGMDIIF